MTIPEREQKMKHALKSAGQTIALFLEPGRPHNAEETLLQLIDQLNNWALCEALRESDELEKSKPQQPGGYPHLHRVATGL